MPEEFKYRIDVMRGGARVTELTAVSPPSIQADAEAEIKTSIAMTVLENSDADLLNDELKVWAIKGEREYPCGVYRVGTITEKITDGKTQIELEAYDRGSLLAQTRTETILHFAAGTQYLTAIRGLLAEAGIYELLADDNSDVLMTDREDWEIGTDYLTIINQLLTEINFKTVFFNKNGFAMLKKEKMPDASEMKMQLSDQDKISVISDSMTKETDVFERANVFIVICENPDYEQPMIAEGKNTNPQSKLSIYQKGRKIVEVSYVDNVADETALQIYAERLALESQFLEERLEITTVKLPEIEVNDVIGLQNGKIFGLYTVESYDLSLEIGAGMKINMKRLVMI